MQEQTIIYAKDYQEPAYFIDKTFLRFELSDDVTHVYSQLVMRRNSNFPQDPLQLDGQDVELLSLKLNGEEINKKFYQVESEGLVIQNDVLPDTFELQCKTAISPEKNTSLEGLYRSRGMYCTQCEAEGFRKITYYLDRPDVMSEFEVTIVAEKNSFPVMLSNGNCISDFIDGSLRTVVWHDPFKKPCYLFALVAGDLSCVEDTFITCSKKQVSLKIYVEEKDLDKCAHAMDSLKRSMRWDEEVYGREYDLDNFMIVAVDDFNMGAMENKGLNIFNTSCVLANPATTTDDGYERVEAVVAHEYFHNWSGNRVTCRDWFQLSLKEGFTVFRDAEFSADMNSRDVKRIEDVIFLRAFQFPEDAGPMAHPVRPDSYIEISNFYTVTIYEKGAEVVRMLANILGREKFRQATDLYFERHDGQAVTCEDFVKCMEEYSGIDLQQFRLWYSQSGTPELVFTDDYDEVSLRYTLNVHQFLPNNTIEKKYAPFHIPVKIALYGDAGALPLDIMGMSNNDTTDNTEVVLDVIESKSQFVFENVKERPVPSLLRGFSAPVKQTYNYTDEQLAHLIAIDTDGFSRWDACQSLAVKIIKGFIVADNVDSSLSLLVTALKNILKNDVLDYSMMALMIRMPSEVYIAEFYEKAEPLKIFTARRHLQQYIAKNLHSELLDIYNRLNNSISGIGADARSARSLRNAAMSYLMLLGDIDVNELCFKQFQSAVVMTDQIASLKALVNSQSASEYASLALDQFYQQWKHEPLVVNMWLQVQATGEHDNALSNVQALLTHEAFTYKNPNKVRALIGAFCQQNFMQFHHVSGCGYQFLAEQVIVLDKINPQIASRLLTPLTRWKRLEPIRSGLMREILKTISNQNLSKDVYEVVSKSLLN
jgi:aminopeptidase N